MKTVECMIKGIFALKHVLCLTVNTCPISYQFVLVFVSLCIQLNT